MAAPATADQSDISGVHLTFTTGEEWAALAELGFKQRLGLQVCPGAKLLDLAMLWAGYGFAKPMKWMILVRVQSKVPSTRKIMLITSLPCCDPPPHPHNTPIATSSIGTTPAMSHLTPS